MTRPLCASLLCFLFFASSAWCSPIISFGTHDISNADLEYLIPILVSSDTHEHIEGLILAVQIADGGLPNSGTATAPQITNLDLIGPGTIFNASNTGCTPEYLGVGPGNDPPYLIAMAETTAASGDLEANGVLAYLTVKPSGAPFGSYRVFLQNVGENVTGGPWTTDFAGTPASFPDNDGWINIVPEPSAFLLLLTASVMWL